nr:MAG TPA: hypothetical protein [Caudoviricetes sp.]
MGNLLKTNGSRTIIWECLHSAYKVISGRKGKMIDGQFVKD